jgi:hypothetical protein
MAHEFIDEKLPQWTAACALHLHIVEEGMPGCAAVVSKLHNSDLGVLAALLTHD